MFDGCKRKKLETRRQEILSGIRWNKSAFETMMQRAKAAGDTSDDALVSSVLQRLEEIELRAKEDGIDIDELSELENDADQQGQLRAYICPHVEIADEGSLSIGLIEEWNVPKTVIAELRSSLGEKIRTGEPNVARSALRAIFEERDSWEHYTDEYDETMRDYTRKLFLTSAVTLLLAVSAFHFSPSFSPLFFGGLLCAGATGSCVSVMAKMPLLDLRLSPELDAYERRILSRIGVGVIASLIGCALLGWGLFPISFQGGQTFAEILDVCTASPATFCDDIKTLIILCIPMLFGFSERALTSFEQNVFGK
jgi:hypothetical protein